MKRAGYLFLGYAILLVFSLVGCGTLSVAPLDSVVKGSGAAPEIAAGDAISGPSGFIIPSGEQPGSGQPPQAGILTAGLFDDNKYFDVFRKYEGEFLSENGQYSSLPVFDRKKICVFNEDNQSVVAAKVSLLKDLRLQFSGITDVKGCVNIFPTLYANLTENLQVKIESDGIESHMIALSDIASDQKIIIPSAKHVLPSLLDLVFVVDTTGSMGDEISFLQEELEKIIRNIKSSHASVDIKIGLVVYRDEGEPYITRSFALSSDVDQIVSDLKLQQASGGGDYEESMDVAMRVAVENMQWREQAARLLFLVADAPPHHEDVVSFYGSVVKAHKKGIKIYSVAASGVSDEAEYLMRLSSTITGAKYIFLTDDSGVGNPHANPHIPCYKVKLLNTILEEVITSELTSEDMLDVPGTVLRTVGYDEQGKCQLSMGTKKSEQ